MPNNQNRRHRLLVDVPVQFGVAARLILLWAIMTLLTAATGVLLQSLADPTLGLHHQLTSLHNWAPSLLAFAVMAPIAVLYMFRFTHRFVGPVFRLRSELRRLAAGEDRPPLKFRDRDYWTEMADDFNAVAARLREPRDSGCGPGADGAERPGLMHAGGQS